MTISNTNLTSLTGLEGLTIIGSASNSYSKLTISNNASLTSLTGLEGLTEIIGYEPRVTIADNPALTSLTGLESLTYIADDGYGFLSIRDNDALTSLTGVEGLTFLYGLTISNNDALISLTGLEGLTSGVWMEIWDNDALTSLTGLESLHSVYDSTVIRDNDALTNLCALYNMYTGTLSIYDNLVLSMDTTYALETHLINNGFTGTFNIHDNNGSGLVSCDSDDDGIADVSDDDTIFGYVSGDVQEDVTINFYIPSCGGDVLSETTTTGPAGYFSIGSLETKAYQVIPEYGAFSFNPISLSVEIPQTEIQAYNFTSTQDLNTICGQVTGAVQKDVIISLFNNSCGSSDFVDATLTDSTGSYCFSEISNGDYVLHPTKTGYNLTPQDVPVILSDNALSGVDFISEVE